MEGNKIVMPTIGALIAAVIGGGVWALIAVLTNYELGLVAWAIGGLTGYAVAILANRRVNAAHQLIAVIASLLGILLGKYFIVSYLLSDGIDGVFNSDSFAFFKENFTEFFKGMDIVFVVLAVATAWQLPRKLANQAPSQDQTVTPE